MYVRTYAKGGFILRGSCPLVVSCVAAHFAGREGHLMCLQTLVLAHDNIQAVLEVRNDEVGEEPLTTARPVLVIPHSSVMHKWCT